MIALVELHEVMLGGEACEVGGRFMRQFRQEVVAVRRHESEARGIHTVIVQQRVELVVDLGVVVSVLGLLPGSTNEISDEGREETPQCSEHCGKQ